MKALLLILFTCALAGCVYLVEPSRTTVYDEGCDLISRKMELTVTRYPITNAANGCEGEVNCIGQIAAQFLLTPASAIVSGSVVVVGNTVYWIEKQGRCYAKS